MEIEVGEYIRTNKGTMGQIIEKRLGKFFKGKDDDEIPILKNVYELDIKQWTTDEYIVKHSKNIIDLIEEDDIVILEYYVKKYRQRITRKFEVGIVYGKIYFDNRHCSFWYDLENKKWGDAKGFNPKIKSILTKEQYEQNSYKL